MQKIKFQIHLNSIFYTYEKKFQIINPDSIQYSDKIIELSNERIVEIGEYLFEFILGIESELDYFIYED